MKSFTKNRRAARKLRYVCFAQIEGSAGRHADDGARVLDAEEAHQDDQGKARDHQELGALVVTRDILAEAGRQSDGQSHGKDQADDAGTGLKDGGGGVGGQQGERSRWPRRR